MVVKYGKRYLPGSSTLTAMVYGVLDAVSNT
jgi:hypothetical protein